MSAVSASILLRLAAVSRVGGAARDLLQEVGVPPDLDRDTAARSPVAAAAYYDFLERIGDGDPGLPMRYAEGVAPEDFGAMGLAMKTAPTARAALQRLVRYITVISDTLGYGLDEGEGTSALVVRGRAPRRPGMGLANECALGAVAALLRQMTRAGVSPVEVTFRHPEPALLDDHRRVFGVRPRFGAPLDALVYRADALSSPTRLADEGLSSFLLAHLDEQTAARAPSLAEQVARAVTDALCDGPPSKGAVARRLGMSERTLHRRLAEDGASFRAVAERARRETAEVLLASPRNSLADVAFLSGFADQSAFQRAFKRWTGTTPATWRREAG